MKALLFVVLLVSAARSFSQLPLPRWDHTQHTYQLTGVTVEEFKLDGKYLTPPKDAEQNESPSIIIRCIADPHANHGRARGKFVQGYIYIGAILDGDGMAYRRDDGKLQTVAIDHSSDLKAAFFGQFDLNNLLYGHMLPHKENTGPQTRKLIIGLGEYLGGDVVSEFQLPDSTELAETCGAIWHK